jgi:hypothetical protein
MKNSIQFAAKSNRNSGLKSCSLVALILFVFLAFKPLATRADVKVNIVLQPLWGPVHYDYVEYYYLPEAEIYYYVPFQKFVYLSNGVWLMSSALPAVYHINLFTTYKVVINRSRPYLQHPVYLKKYRPYRTYVGKQVIIRDSRDAKYYVVKGHPMHGKAPAAKTAKQGSSKTKKPTAAAGSKSGSGKKQSAGVSKSPSGTKMRTAPAAKQGSMKPAGGKSGGGKPAGGKSGGSKKSR